jgi:hypothetical protein
MSRTSSVDPPMLPPTKKAVLDRGGRNRRQVENRRQAK